MLIEEEDRVLFQAMLSGLKPGMILNSNATDPFKKNLLNAATVIGVNVALHGQSLYRPNLLQERLDREPSLAAAIGWNDECSIATNIDRLYDEPILQHGVFGLIAGYPTSAILGFMTEQRLRSEGLRAIYEVRNYLLARLERIRKPPSNGPYERALATIASAAPDRKTLLRRMIVEEACEEDHDRPLFKAFYEALGIPTETALFLSSRCGADIRNGDGSYIFSFITYKGLGFQGMDAPDVLALRQKVRIAYSLS